MLLEAWLIPSSVAIVAAIISFTLAFLLGYWPLSNATEAAKADILAALCAPLGLTYRPHGESKAARPAHDLRLLPDWSDESYEDFFSGRRRGVRFEICEAYLSKRENRDERSVFAGLILHLTTPRRLGSTIVVLREGAWASAFAMPYGLQPVGLESPRFKATFRVFGTDQVEAREILTPVAMERLMALDSGLIGAELRCAFRKDDIYVVLQGGGRFQVGSAFKSLLTRAPVDAVLSDLPLVLRLVDAFHDA